MPERASGTRNVWDLKPWECCCLTLQGWCGGRSAPVPAQGLCFLLLNSWISLWTNLLKSPDLISLVCMKTGGGSIKFLHSPQRKDILLHPAVGQCDRYFLDYSLPSIYVLFSALSFQSLTCFYLGRRLRLTPCLWTVQAASNYVFSTLGKSPNWNILGSKQQGEGRQGGKVCWTDWATCQKFYGTTTPAAREMSTELFWRFLWLFLSLGKLALWYESRLLVLGNEEEKLT